MMTMLRRRCDVISSHLPAGLVQTFGLIKSCNLPAKLMMICSDWISNTPLRYMFAERYMFVIDIRTVADPDRTAIT